MWLGPLNRSDFERAKAVLDEAGVPYEIYANPEEAEELARRYAVNPLLAGTNPFALAVPLGCVYLGIEPEHTLSVGAKLKALGLDAIPAPVPEESETSWHCPEGDFDSTEQGTCPKHGVPLVSFEAHAALDRGRRERAERWIAVIFALAFLGFFVWIAIRSVFFD